VSSRNGYCLTRMELEWEVGIIFKMEISLGHSILSDMFCGFSFVVQFASPSHGHPSSIKPMTLVLTLLIIWFLHLTFVLIISYLLKTTFLLDTRLCSPINDLHIFIFIFNFNGPSFCIMYFYSLLIAICSVFLEICYYLLQFFGPALDDCLWLMGT